MDKALVVVVVSIVWFIMTTIWLGWDTLTGSPKDFPSVSAYVSKVLPVGCVPEGE